MVSVAAAIVGHPARQAAGEALAAQLGASLLLDHDSRGAGWNHRRALTWGVEQGATHILALEDDALPVDDLLTHVEAAIEHRPNGDGLIGLYVGRSRPRAQQVARAVRAADTEGASWLTCPALLWGVGTVWPADMAATFLAEAGDDARWDSHAVTPWLVARGLTVAYTWPSLVDHADETSLVVRREARESGRAAWRAGVPSWNRLAVEV